MGTNQKKQNLGSVCSAVFVGSTVFGGYAKRNHGRIFVLDAD
jgi:hypothetical protein